jgi:hypothetical protein
MAGRFLVKCKVESVALAGVDSTIRSGESELIEGTCGSKDTDFSFSLSRAMHASIVA